MEGVRRSKRTPNLKKDQKSIDHSIKPASESANVQNPVLDTVKKTVRQPKQKLKANQNVKNVVKGATNTSTQEAGSVCAKQASRKIRKLGTFVIDCDEIVGEKRVDMDNFKTYLQKKIKVGGKRNDKRVNVEQQDMKIFINADVFIEKTSIKYWIKLYLKENKLNNWIQVVNGKKSYSLKYFRLVD